MNDNSKIGRDIPEQLKRDVLVEAGHRCAIPTCRQTTVEIAHIIPWETVQEHTFENLIALCPNCHDLYDKKHMIDRKAMQQYKANLSLINQRHRNSEIDEANNSIEQGSQIILDRFAFDPIGYEIWHKVF
jgi:hypothetical protein